MKIHIGIDIGSEGAYSIFIDGQLKTYGKIPGTEELHVGDLIDEIQKHLPAEDLTIHVCFEDLHSVFGSSASSNFQFGVNNGLIIGMVQTLRMAYTKVQAKKWQKKMWEGIRPVEIPVKGKLDKQGNQKYKIDTKATSIIAAKRLFPDELFLPTPRCKVPDNNIVDAVLIGLYCARHF